MNLDEEIQENVDVLQLNKNLKQSVYAQNINRVSFYLRKGAEASMRVNKDAGNLLHHNKDPSIAALLISKGARVNARNRYQVTPLFLAVKDGNYELAKTLLKHGADVHCYDMREKNTAFNVAVWDGNLSMVKLLLQYGSVVNDQTNFFSNTPLHIALTVKRIKIRIVSLLLEKGANVNILNCLKESPLHLATKNIRCPPLVVKKLIDHGALINLKDFEGCSPLQHALDIDHYEVIKLLLKNGAELLPYNSSGFNVLQNYIISRHAKVNIVKCILKNSCTPEASEECYANCLTEEGVSPLLLALYCINWIDITIIKELLHYGADALVILSNEKGEFTMFDHTLLMAEQSKTDAEELLDSCENNSAFRRKKEHAVQIMKWLIKYSAMKSKDNVPVMRSKLKVNSYFCNYLNECLDELSMIEQEIGVLFNKFTKPASLKDALPSQIVDKIIQIHASNSFNIYQEVVIERLRRSDVLNKLQYELFTFCTQKGQTYVLNWTIACHLVKYLSTQDLLNLFGVFYPLPPQR